MGNSEHVFDISFFDKINFTLSIILSHKTSYRDMTLEITVFMQSILELDIIAIRNWVPMKCCLVLSANEKQ